MEGVFIAGVAAGPKDIVDTIAEAGAAAMEASIYLKEFNSGQAA
jgi:heterodisulfide reductase subunit A2